MTLQQTLHRPTEASMAGFSKRPAKVVLIIRVPNVIMHVIIAGIANLMKQASIDWVLGFEPTVNNDESL